ncbi:MAG: hypothetical protein AAF362_14265 [Pseudomonadota bacterium]
MRSQTIRLENSDSSLFLFPLVIITVWCVLNVVNAIAQTNDSSRYDDSFRQQTVEDTEWRLPLSDDFGWDPEPTRGQGRPGMSAEFNDPIRDHAIQPFDRPVNRSTGMSLRFQF